MTIHQFYQPPLLWQQFEAFAVQLLSEVYDVPAPQPYGRPGQAQHGVDAYGRSRKHGLIAMQCKRLSGLDANNQPLPGGPISRKFFFDEAKAIEGFRHEISIWILVTTARRDTRVQGYAEELNERWVKRGIDRTATVWSWDDCVSYLNSFPELRKRYYRDVIQVNSVGDLDQMILETISMAFDRTAFELPLHIETPTEFQQALQDTQRAVRTGVLLDRTSRHAIRKSIGGWRQIHNRDWRDVLRKIDKDLRTMRAGLEQGLKDGSIRRISNFLDFTDRRRADALENLRRGCVRQLNAVLIDAGLPPI
ncbi:hypothetical protein [Sinorhizobium meliloti]|uniref:hypothetical protein n=1 Tax=Rhizobium meliloti TaxID=382 RepID=UPI0020738894|nr:hypothetical protein [Sinorhizobium meliloti]